MWVVLGVVGTILAATTQMASADAVADAFTALGTSATTVIGLGVALIVTVLTLGFGVGLLVKFARKARASA